MASRQLQGLVEWMRHIRRTLHRKPELAFAEHATQQLVCSTLDSLGITWRPLAGTGVIAEIVPTSSEARSKKWLVLRADMDALPIHENTGLPFSSEIPNCMHACGHDGHTAMLLGAAKLIVERQRLLENQATAGGDVKEPDLSQDSEEMWEELQAGLPSLEQPVRLIFQPAEETSQGAKRMVEEGCLEDAGVVFGGHLDRKYPCGDIVVHDGCVNASNDAFFIDITGRGGHAARPHQCVDAVVVGAHIVQSLQYLVSRRTSPADPCVVTVGTFSAGSSYNVIAATASLSGSIRAMTPETRSFLHQQIQHTATSCGDMFGADVETRIQLGVSPVINDHVAVAAAQDAALWATRCFETSMMANRHGASSSALEDTAIADTDAGAQESQAALSHPNHVYPLPAPNMGGEDFCFYLDKVPGCYVRLGAAIPGQPEVSAHSSVWDFHEDTMLVGALYYARLAFQRQPQCVHD